MTSRSASSLRIDAGHPGAAHVGDRRPRPGRTRRPSTVAAIAVAALGLAGPASAEWVKVIETDVVVQYVDPTTITKNGDLRKAWRLQDFKSPTPDGKQSMRILGEYDCKGERMRILFGSSYTGPMASGESLFLGGGNVDDWDRAPAGTMGELVLKFVCSH